MSWKFGGDIGIAVEPEGGQISQAGPERGQNMEILFLQKCIRWETASDPIRDIQNSECPYSSVHEGNNHSRRVSVADSSSGNSLNARPKTESLSQQTTAPEIYTGAC